MKISVPTAHVPPFDSVDKESIDKEVNHPSHYNNGSIECLEYIKQQLGSGYPKYLEGNIIKYIHRHNLKESNNIKDLKKGEFYLKELIRYYEDL